MRSAQESYFVAVLDRPPELKVVLEYIESRAYLSRLPASNTQVMEGLSPLRDIINPGASFYSVTEYDETRHKGVIKEGAEKPLGSVEASIAFSAARWVLDRKNPVSQIRNRLNGLRAAAIGMANYFQRSGIHPWEGFHPSMGGD